MLPLTLRGTPTMWQGDTLGMVHDAGPGQMLRDPWAIDNPGTGAGRDPVRIPILWEDNSPGRGSPSGAPVLPLSSAPPRPRRNAIGDPCCTSSRRSCRSTAPTPSAASSGSMPGAASWPMPKPAAPGTSRRPKLFLRSEAPARPRRDAPVDRPDRDLAEQDGLLPEKGVIIAP